MKYRLVFSILLVSALAFVACGDDSNDEPAGSGESTGVVLTCTPSQIDVPTDGGTYTLNVSTTSNSWAAFVDEADKEWVTIKTQNASTSNGTVEVTVAYNNKSFARTGHINVQSGGKKVIVSVNQEALANNDPAEKTSESGFVPAGYTKVWSDEFNQGTQLSTASWEWENQNSGWVNNEIQNYRSGSQTISGMHTTELVNGYLYINCFKGNDGKVYSGRVNAKNGGNGWQYGYFEARMKLPKGKGTWPAYWMMPISVDWANEGWPKCGEIDIMEEVGVDANVVSSSLHAEGHNHVNNTQVTRNRNIGTAESEYHIYALEWTADYIKTYVDGVELLSYNSDHTVRNFPYDKPFHLILNLAWGGDWGGYAGVDDSALPLTMKVDYVRVYQKK